MCQFSFVNNCVLGGQTFWKNVYLLNLIMEEALTSDTSHKLSPLSTWLGQGWIS
jgi:hypothetical protein